MVADCSVSNHTSNVGSTQRILLIDRLPNQKQVKDLLLDLLERNESLVREQQDVGVTIFATPGCLVAGQPGTGQAGTGQPTFAVHLNPIDHRTVQRRRVLGQPLVVTNIEQPSECCWPRTIKVRSRIHYYLADMAARKRDDEAVGVLVDSDGNLTETSIANLAIVQSGQIFSPPEGKVLGGITQAVVESLAIDLKIVWNKHSVTRDQFRQADEILLMGTDGGIWFANQADGQPIGDRLPGPIYRSLLARFDQKTAPNRSKP